MQYFDDVPFSKECLVELSQDDFPLTHKCAKHFQNDDPVVIRILHDQEINHPLAIMMFEEKTSENIHIYSLEVHPNCRYNFYGRRMIDRLKENHTYIDLTTLPESKIFYEKRGFNEEEDGHMVWRKPVLNRG